MTAERVEAADRWTARVVSAECGVYEVRIGEQTLRASMDGCLLAAVARDRSRAPRVGDQVQLRTWPDGRVTVVRRLGGPDAQVLPLRRPRG